MLLLDEEEQWLAHVQAIIGNYAVPILEDKQVWGTSDDTRTAYLDSQDVARMALAALRCTPASKKEGHNLHALTALPCLTAVSVDPPPLPHSSTASTALILTCGKGSMCECTAFSPGAPLLSVHLFLLPNVCKVLLGIRQRDVLLMP